MAKRQRKKVTTDKIKSGYTIIEHLQNLSEKKLDWNKYSEADAKTYTPYMINKWLSMNYNLAEIVNIFQPYTVGLLEKREHYKLYYGILPKDKIWIRYIKSKKDVKYNSEMLDYLVKYFELSRSEIEEYLDLYVKVGLYEQKIGEILKKYGIDDKKVKGLMKIT